MIYSSIPEIKNRISKASEENEITFIHPQDAEQLLKYIQKLEKQHSKDEWAWLGLFFLIIFVFVGWLADYFVIFQVRDKWPW